MMMNTVTFYCLDFSPQCVALFFFNSLQKACKFVRWTTGTVLVVCFYIFFVYLNNPVLLFVVLSFATFVDSPLKLKGCCSNLAVPILYFPALVLLLHMYFPPFSCSWRFQFWKLGWITSFLVIYTATAPCSRFSLIQYTNTCLYWCFFFLEWPPGYYSWLLMFRQSLRYFHRHKSKNVYHCVCIVPSWLAVHDVLMDRFRFIQPICPTFPGRSPHRWGWAPVSDIAMG